MPRVSPAGMHAHRVPRHHDMLLSALSFLLPLVLILPSPAAAAYPTGFLCRDQNPQCAQWKRNIERHGWRNCQGPDHEHMLHNCAETCNLCKEAKSRWKQTPEGQKYVDVGPYAALDVSVSASSPV